MREGKAGIEAGANVGQFFRTGSNFKKVNARCHFLRRKKSRLAEGGEVAKTAAELVT
jgi:hypothetical protein